MIDLQHRNKSIENDGEENIAFRSTVGALHSALLHSQIENEPEGVISFESIVVETNKETQIKDSYKSIEYYLLRTDKATPGDVDKMLVIAKDKAGLAFFKLEQKKWDLEELRKSKGTKADPLTDFDKCLSDAQKATVIDFYKKLHPRKPECLILKDSPQTNKYMQPINHFKMGGANFVKDSDLVCKGLIEVLYLLRNKLFHGEISPNDGCQEVYQHAYIILMTILKKLK